MGKTAIVILNWNGRHFLEKFLPSVISYSSFPDIDIWVADNGSTDDSLSYTEAHFPSVKCLRIERNYGFAGGYNRALDQIKADYYVILNSDVEVSEAWLNRPLEILETMPEVAAVMPKIRMYDNRSLFEYAGAAGGFIDKLGYPFCRGRIFDVVESDKGQYDNEIEVFWATGACLFIRSKCFHELGGFDELFFAHMEEIDLCWRLKNHTYKIMCTPLSVVYHVGAGTLKKESPMKTFLNYRNNLFMLYKNLPTRYLFSKIFFRMILDGVSALKYLASFQVHHFIAVLKAHIHFWKNIGRLNKFRKENNSDIPSYLPSGMFPRIVIFDTLLLGRRTYDSLTKR